MSKLHHFASEMRRAQPSSPRLFAGVLWDAPETHTGFSEGNKAPDSDWQVDLNPDGEELS